MPASSPREGTGGEGVGGEGGSGGGGEEAGVAVAWSGKGKTLDSGSQSGVPSSQQRSSGRSWPEAIMPGMRFSGKGPDWVVPRAMR